MALRGLFRGFAVLHVVLVLVAAVLLCNAAQAATVSVVPSGGGYVVQGSGMNGVAGIEVNINYDVSSGSGPSVSQGSAVSGAMFVANTNIAGMVRIAVISTNPFRGDGPIAQINFSGKLTSGRFQMIDTKGVVVAAEAVKISSNGSSSDNNINAPFNPGAGTPSGGGSSGGTSTTGPGYLGSVTMPSETRPESTSRPSSDQAAGQFAGPQGAATGQPAESPREPAAEKPQAEEKQPEAAPTQTVYAPIVERFKDYQGPKTLEAMAELFRKPVAENITQEPPVVLSDGKTKVTLRIRLDKRSSSPNFALSGAKMLSISPGEDGSWIMQVMPNEKIAKAMLMVAMDQTTIDYPLAIAPPAAGVKLDEAGFQAFLKTTGTPREPQHDLNGDGLRDYNDTYVFVANYLVKKGAGQPAKVEEKQTKPQAPKK